MTGPNVDAFAQRRVVRDQYSQAPAVQLCNWLFGFCGALVVVMIASFESGEPARRVDSVMHVPDPDYLVERCSQPRTGFITADLPSCPDQFPVSLEGDR